MAEPITPADPIARIQAEARAFAATVDATRIAARVVILDDAGSVLAELAIPVDIRPRTPGKAGGGWEFPANCVRFEGRLLKVSGRALDVLRLLAASAVPLGVEQLREAWGDYPIGDSTVRFAIAELRKRLRAEFPTFTDGDPIENVTGGYWLAIR
jgi:hypothetical protein